MLTALITSAWVLIVGLSRVRRPLLTLVMAGAGYAVVTIITSGLLLRGGLSAIAGSMAILVTNLAWGAVAGLLALGLQSIRGARRS